MALVIEGEVAVERGRRTQRGCWWFVDAGRAMVTGADREVTGSNGHCRRS